MTRHGLMGSHRDYEIDQELKEFKEQGYSFIPGSLVKGYWALGVPLLSA